jgi:hypothetical protein
MDALESFTGMLPVGTLADVDPTRRRRRRRRREPFGFSAALPQPRRRRRLPWGRQDGR